MTRESKMSEKLLDEKVAKRFLEKGGKWQMRQIVVFLLTYISTSVQIMAIVFTGFSPHFTCADKELNGTDIPTDFFDDKCKVWNSTTNTSSVCSGGYIWDVGEHESIVSDWGLVCSGGYLSETSQLLYTIGMAVGSLFVPPLSDRLGRRRLFLLLRFVYLFCVFGVAVIPNIIGFMVLRFLTGALGMALGLVRFVYLMELSPMNLRPLMGILTGIIWAVCLCLLDLIAYLLQGQSWRILQAVISVPALLVIIEIMFIKESLMWLYANDRQEEGSKLLRQAMKLNGVTEEMFLRDENLDSSEKSLELSQVSNGKYITNGNSSSEKSVVVNKGYINTDNEDKKANKKGDTVKISCQNTIGEKLETEKANVSILDVLKNRTARILTMMVCFAWFVNSLVYYGIFFMSNALAGDRFLNFFLNSVVDIPAGLTLFALMKFFGRKKPLVGLHGLCAVALLFGGIMMITLENESRYVVMQIVSIIGKFGISATFSLIYIYTTEVYPTNFRATGLGIGSTSARLGSFMSPFAGVLARQLPWGPGIIFGGLCLVLSLILLWAPETHNKALPKTLGDVEILKKGKKANEVIPEKCVKLST